MVRQRILEILVQQHTFVQNNPVPIMQEKGTVLPLGLALPLFCKCGIGCQYDVIVAYITQVSDSMLTVVTAPREILSGQMSIIIR